MAILALWKARIFKEPNLDLIEIDFSDVQLMKSLLVQSLWIDWETLEKIIVHKLGYIGLKKKKKKKKKIKQKENNRSLWIVDKLLSYCEHWFPVDH